jgi:molybdopterin converting factor small subunit
MITVRVPSILRQPEMPAEIHVEAHVATIDELIGTVDRQYPGFALAAEDTLYNFAVNDALVLHRAGQHPIADGDVVEIIPTISGG